MIKLRINLRINLTIALVVAGVLLLFGTYDAVRTFSQALAQQHAAVDLSSERLANELWVHVHDYNREQIQRAVAMAMGDADIYGIAVRDALDDSVIYAMRRTADWRPVETATIPNGSGYTATTKAIVQNGQNLGIVATYVTDQFVRDRVWREMLARLASIAVVLMAATLALALALRKNVLAPLLALQQTFKAVAEGKLDAGIDTSRSDELGSLARSFAAMRDAIREKIKALEESERRFRTLVDQAGDAVFVNDIDGKLVDVNNRACESLGRTREELLAMHVSDLKDDDRTQETLVALWRSLVPGEPRTVESVHRRKDGSNFPVEIRVGALSVGDQRLFLALARDVSDRKEAERALKDQEERLRHAQKMEAVGQLAGGIAHDFNNLLVAVLGNAELLQRALPVGSKQARSAQMIREAGARAADLTRQLLTFSRKSPMRSVSVNMNEIIGEVIQVLERSIDKRIEIHSRLAADLAGVRGDPTSLQSAILNLGLNARDAMPDGGKLTFSTRQVTLDPSSSRNFGGEELRPGTFVEVAVVDTGVGIPPDLRERIFEPFFTTKPQGQGTGLGLASVFGCSKSHGGAITVDSTVGAGTAFRIFLPADGVAPVARSLRDQAAVEGKGHVLVVDDEPYVREVLTTALEGLGYSVQTAENGVAALRHFQTHAADVDLVLLDLIMPKLSGQDTLKRLREITPAVRIIVTSGFAHDTAVTEALKHGAVGFLSKPFSISELSSEVARSIRK